MFLHRNSNYGVLRRPVESAVDLPMALLNPAHSRDAWRISGGEDAPKSVLPHPYRLLAKIDPVLVQQVFHGLGQEGLDPCAARYSLNSRRLMDRNALLGDPG
jgi:hypothetical protein